MNPYQKCGGGRNICGHAAAYGYAKIIQWTVDKFHVTLDRSICERAALCCNPDVIKILGNIPAVRRNYIREFNLSLLAGAAVMGDLPHMKWLKTNFFKSDCISYCLALTLKYVIVGANVEMLHWVLNEGGM